MIFSLAVIWKLLITYKKALQGNSERQIFLWGQSGLGKSHLLQACCHQAQSLQTQLILFCFITF